MVEQLQYQLAKDLIHISTHNTAHLEMVARDLLVVNVIKNLVDFCCVVIVNM